MKIQCNACESAEAKVLCCADEAALCWACDEKIHTANKLAEKHQRVPLTGSSSSQVPKCDICKEASGYFFCLEDRALLCRKCDTAIHSVNNYVLAHQRFLITGVKVGPEHEERTLPSPEELHNHCDNSYKFPSKCVERSPLKPLAGETSQLVSSHVDYKRDLASCNDTFRGEAMTGSAPDWPPEDFFDFGNFNQNFGFFEHGASKADSEKLGSMQGSPLYSSECEDLGVDFFGQVPEVPWTVPEVLSPPTASGMHWSKIVPRQFVGDSAFVPDICSLEYPEDYQHISPALKRRRPH